MRLHLPRHRDVALRGYAAEVVPGRQRGPDAVGRELEGHFQEARAIVSHTSETLQEELLKHVLTIMVNTAQGLERPVSPHHWRGYSRPARP
jgi:hypothetical protein